MHNLLTLHGQYARIDVGSQYPCKEDAVRVIIHMVLDDALEVNQALEYAGDAHML